MRALDAGALADRLGSLPVTVAKVHCRFGHARRADYPQGRRPTTLVSLVGQGQIGFGENVAFVADEHRSFARRAEALLARPEGVVATMVRDIATPYERAALEGALVDLAMRQARLSLRGLAGAADPVGRLRWVSSFSDDRDPAAHLRALRRERGAREFKIDVNPRWSPTAIATLAAESGVVILDFKQSGTAELCAQLSGAFPGAFFEDPPPGCTHALVAIDRSLSSAADLATAIAAGRHVNLKAPRMGGFLALLRSLSLAQACSAPVYFGGMFEVGPGRAQARQLASLFCPEAPNDLGPLAGEVSPPGRSPASLRLDDIGFGAVHDWATLPLD